MKTIGLILAAGNQNRFNSDIPKALVKYKDWTVLDENINNMKEYVDKIYVICSNNNITYFNDRKYPNKVKLINISSGLGCGHGVMKALQEIKKYEKDFNAILIWGDSLQEKETIKTCISNYKKSFIVPVVLEHKPYVQFKIDNVNTILSVNFSKFNDEIDDYGYHDLSIFMFSSKDILEKLNVMHTKYWNKDKKIYNTNSKELTFLNLFNEFKYFGKVIIMDNIKAKSYNTLEEYWRFLGEK